MVARKASGKKDSVTATEGKASVSAPSSTTDGKAKRKMSSASAVAVDEKEEETDVRIDGRVSRVQIEKACSALVAHRERQRKTNGVSELPLDGDEEQDDFGEGARSSPSDVVWMQITVKTLNENAPAKPIRVSTPHPVFAKSSSICLLSADPQRTYKDLMVEQKLTQVKRVVGVTKLKGKFAPYEARRQLMNDHDLFLTDDRIVPMLPKLLGKKWMSERKTPIPVQLTKTKDGRVRKSVEAALSSTFYHRNKGTCASVRLGTARHLTPAQLMENAAAVLPVIVEKHVKGKWNNVQSIDLKTGTSAALPVWNCNVADRWAGMPEKETVAETGDDEADPEIVKPAAKKVKAAATAVQPKKPLLSKQGSAPAAASAKKKARRT